MGLRSKLAFAPLIGVAFLLPSACGPKLPHPPFVAQPTSALAEVEIPPPPAHIEMVPPLPDAPAAKGAVWLDGEWTWRGRKWSWKPGRWVVPPPGAAFSPWTTVRGTTGVVYFAPGTWRDARGVAVDEPAPLAVAGLSSGVVFDADGEVERSVRTGAASVDTRSADGGA